ncbi:hypothetical protein Indivirus_4_7 [Indivirus ILV1]|uniref:Uncharacterized protein n=1 Tax=Indivirus ILV1 TaxID=1977633 RepID=A0A1V0SDP7_9VIRU|nr:hypothetical protein Indivirus_4_7 [Indivirus ILV1]
MMFIILFYISVSLGCFTDSECSSDKPHCNPDTGSCEMCYTDAHCKNNNQCNAICNSFTCGLPNGQSSLICNSTQVCYEFNGLCLSRCNIDTDCRFVPMVLHYPNTGVCDTIKGKCYDCLVTSDCKPYRNETCNAQCSFNSGTLEYLCGNGNLCSVGSQCMIKNDHFYQCSNNDIIKPYMWLLLCFLFII